MFTATALAFLIAAPQDDSYTLQWKLKEGDVIYNKSVNKLEQTVEAMGFKQDQSMTTTSVLRFKVKSVARDATVVEMTYLENKIEAEGLPIDAAAGDKMKGVTFTVTLDDNMKVKKFEGYDKFLDAVSDGDENARKLMKAVMPEATMRRAFEQTFLFSPNKKVAVGDKWDHSDSLSLGPLGNMEIKHAAKLESVKDDIATIVMKGDMTWKEAKDGEDIGIKIKKVDFKAEEMKTTYRFDLKNGRPIDTKMEAKMGGTMTIDAGGMDVETKITQKLTTTGTMSEKSPIKE